MAEAPALHHACVTLASWFFSLVSCLSGLLGNIYRQHFTLLDVLRNKDAENKIPCKTEQLRSETGLCVLMHDLGRRAWHGAVINLIDSI